MLSHMLLCQMPDCRVGYRTRMAWLEQHRHTDTRLPLIYYLSGRQGMCSDRLADFRQLVFQVACLCERLVIKSHSCGTGRVKKPKQTDEPALN